MLSQLPFDEFELTDGGKNMNVHDILKIVAFPLFLYTRILQLGFVWI